MKAQGEDSDRIEALSGCFSHGLEGTSLAATLTLNFQLPER